MSKTLDRIGPFRTKAAEVEFLKDLVERLPSSYLRDVLEPFLVEFEQGVYSDWVPPVRDSWQARIDAAKEVKAIDAEILRLGAEKKAIEQAIARNLERLKTVVETARSVASSAQCDFNSLDRSASR